MSVVTISREYGSGGREVARKVADLLGYHLVDKAVMGKILASYGLIDFDADYKEESSVWASLDTSLKTMMGMLERIDLAVARHGHAVILGRGSYAALAGKPGVLNVRLCAPFDWRVERVMREQSIGDRSKAEIAVREGDKLRASFVSSVYGIRWNSIEHIDLAMNTSKIGLDRAAKWIDEAVRNIPADSSRAGLGTPDSVLDDAITAEFACDGKGKNS
jgi:cytidylate kinase